MRVIVLYDDIGDSAGEDEQDTLDQAQAVYDGLCGLGYDVELLRFDGHIQTLESTIEKKRPDLVFNLIETRSGEGFSIGVVPTLLDCLRVRYTGCPSEALWITQNKLVAKRLMRLARIPTPSWISPRRMTNGAKTDGLPSELFGGATYIIKSVWEHASIGLDDRSVVYPDDEKGLMSLLSRKNEKGPAVYFAERYIDGREFNLSLLQADGEVLVLPPAEMQFSKTDGKRPRILSYRAKWEKGTSEYQTAERTFAFGDVDRPLLEEMKNIAVRLWRCFGLNGYARVDFRVEGTRPFVLEINANPCIALDSGFTAAAEKAGIGYGEMIRHIVRHPVFFL
ncbi:MAG: ATP-grasp domain-containing protein [Spirochaetes bacterium]|nr:ATP-grasp domain-containing protein [Spirochaetota bacterium]